MRLVALVALGLGTIFVSAAVAGSTGRGKVEPGAGRAGLATHPCAVAANRAQRLKASLSFERDWSILLASADGRRVTTVLRGDHGSANSWGTAYSQPAWSSDGRCLAVVVQTEDDNGWVEVRRGKQKIGTFGDQSASPAWEPGGRRLVYINSSYVGPWYGGGLNVAVVGAGKTIALTPEPGDWPPARADDMPSWSPNGRTIAFTRVIKQQATRLYLVRPDGTHLDKLPTPAGMNPSWSPDGKQLAFNVGGRIAVINADGSSLRYLTQPASGRIDVDPAWSPDGRTIAFVRYRSANAETGDIWTISPSGKKQQLFVKNGSRPAWKPQ